LLHKKALLLTYDFDKPVPEGDEEMAVTKHEERVISLTTRVNVITGILAVLVPGLLAWGWFITTNVVAIKQQLADGGNTKLVTELKSPKSQDQLQASLSTVIAQVQTERVNGKAPDQKKSVALAEALTQAAKRNPEIPDSWRAVATLASFRTSYILENAASMPDCNVQQTAKLIEPKDIPEVAGAKAFNGYIFRNCVLHLNHLPPLQRTYLTKPYENHPVGSSFTLIAEAVIINCKIVLNDSGIAESNIFFFIVQNCRFEYQIETTPSPTVQKLLLASLDMSNPGQFTLELDKPSETHL